MHADVLVLGSGQAGVPLAKRLAASGRRVVLFERGPLGGTCVNVGCTPTKTFLASAQAAHEVRRAGRLGIRAMEPEVDLQSVVQRKRDVVEQWRAGVQKTVDHEKLRLVRAHARFVDPGVVEANGERFEAPTIVVDVGARPWVPPIPGLDETPWLDNESVMELTELPGHLVVLGGGYIGCEFGQAYRRFGSEVTIVDRGDHLMDREDPDVSEALQDALKEEGVQLRLGVAATHVLPASGGDAFEVELSDGSRLGGSHLLIAVGRRPNTDHLGCEAGGIERDDRGVIVVDDHYRTSAEGVYAVGDCAGGPPFTHASWDDHRILFELLSGEGRRTRSDRVVPYSTFTDPQLARVGLSEREAAARGMDVEVATLPFSRIARAIETDRKPGLVKALVDPRDERLLGAAIVGAQAGELIHVFALLLQTGAKAQALVDLEAVHPTFAEGLQSALMTLERFSLS